MQPTVAQVSVADNTANAVGTFRDTSNAANAFKGEVAYSVKGMEPS
jgi:hypothetical protein